jgi:SsrA-binding protein
MEQDIVNIRYKKAGFNFEFLQKFVAGLQLKGTEIKSVRQRQVNFNDAYCFFKEGELFVKGMHIAEYSHGNIYNHDPQREKKLLLNKKELRKIQKSISEKGLTIVPIRIFINQKGLAKLEIAIARGKKQYDKRATIKDRDAKRNLQKKDYQ